MNRPDPAPLPFQALRETPAVPLLARAQRRGLGRQLTRAAVASAGVALAVAGLVLNLSLHAWSRVALQEDALVQARMAADNSAAALLFADVKAATETLASLRAAPAVAEALLYTPDGRLFASYRRNAGGSDDGMVVETLVELKQRVVGRIVLRVSLTPLHERALIFALLTVVSALLALVIAYLRVRRVRRAIDHTEARLDQLAYFDPVTGLYNRHAANEHLRAMVDSARALGHGFVLMLLDLDDFKLINDTLGHVVGDEVLRLLAGRLQRGLRRNDLVFRFGGDEFIVVCEHQGDDEALDRLGRAALACLDAPLQAGGQEIHARGSVGLARFPSDADSAEALLRAADTAMYAAKASGKNTFAVFSRSMNEAASSQLQLDAELRRAIRGDELLLHYQPIIDLRQGRVIGTEALVRWQHPERGLLMPAAFIDMAERTGLVSDLGAWVLQAAARQQAAWREAGLGQLFIAVNASGRQFKRKLLEQQVADALASSGADPGRLQIEITEHTLVEDVAANVGTLAALRARGVQIAIDDFGTGLSSLAYLKRLPIDKLKIDRSFVRDLPDAAEDGAIVEAIVSLAHALGLQVVAEGVETERQQAWLTQRGVAHAQGYLFSRPVPPEQIPEAIQAVAARWGQQDSAGFASGI